jgi:hypothetical protein
MNVFNTVLAFFASLLPHSGPVHTAAPPSITLNNVQVFEDVGAARLTITKNGYNGRSTYVYIKSTSGTAGSPDDYSGFSSLQISFAPNQTTATVLIPIVNDKKVEDAESFTVTAISASNGRIVRPTATVTIVDNDKACTDGSVVDITATCPIVAPPTPTPTPVPPTPVFQPSSSIAPTLNGLPDIPSEFDPMTTLVGTLGVGVPSSGAPDFGAFRFQCSASHISKDDPIVYPGQPGKSHLHQFFGNTLTNAYSTYESLRTSGMSTCGNPTINPANRSGYWTPTLMDGLGNIIQPTSYSIYYKRWPKTDFHCNSQGGYPTAFNVEGAQCATVPNALRFIMGYNMLHPADTPTGSVQFQCNGDLHNYETMTQALDRCRALTGPQLFIARIEAPNCWDGKNLDSPDHRSHVAYATYGPNPDGSDGWGYLRCPTTHPVVIPTYTMTITYYIQAGDDTTKWHYSSDEMMPGTAPGTTFHGDFYSAWEPVVRAMWTDNCIEKDLNCQSGSVGNGLGLAGGSVSWHINPLTGKYEGYNVGALNPDRLIPVSSIK